MLALLVGGNHVDGDGRFIGNDLNKCLLANRAELFLKMGDDLIGERNLLRFLPLLLLPCPQFLGCLSAF